MGILRIVIAVLVTAIWAAVYTADILSKEFSAPPEVSGPMLAVAAWLFGAEVKKAIRGDGKAASGD